MVIKLNIEGNVEGHHILKSSRILSTSIKKTPIEPFNEKFYNLVERLRGGDLTVTPNFSQIYAELSDEIKLELSALPYNIVRELLSGKRWSRPASRLAVERDGFGKIKQPEVIKKIGKTIGKRKVKTFLPPTPLGQEGGHQLQISLLMFTNPKGI